MSTENKNIGDIENKVKLIVSEILPDTKPSDITKESKIKDLGADSLDIVEIIMKIEEAFNIEIQEKDFQKIETIKDMAEKIDSLKQSKENNSN